MVCGNTSLIKPSERDPGATMMLAQLGVDAGFPDGTLNIIHGAYDGKLVNILCVFLMKIYFWLYNNMSFLCFVNCVLFDRLLLKKSK